ncbi:MAG TPA: hypothetical protein VN607_10475 [Gemmatimonadaceae bacterium]|nr:hypothetical protein [Gemmatimonadaceae bacterium]
MRLPRLLVFAALASLGACKLNSDLPTSRPLGVIVLDDTLSADSSTILSPVAHFFDGSGVSVPVSGITQDSCLVIPYLADTGAFPYSLLTPLNAGDSVLVQAGNTTASLYPELDPLTNAPNGQYDLHSEPLAWVPGTPVSITVPGATGPGTYPAAAVSAATAAPFTVGHIDRAPAEDAFNISYSPAGGTGFAVVFAIAFDTAATATGNPIHLEMYCSDADTGTFPVPVTVARIWNKALPGPRNMRAYRWVTTIQNNGATGLVVISQHNEYAPDAP